MHLHFDQNYLVKIIFGVFMKFMLILALALTSGLSFSATKVAKVAKATDATQACANLTGKELKACEAKNNNVVTAAKEDLKKTAPVVAAKHEKRAHHVTAKNTKAAPATSAKE